MSRRPVLALDLGGTRIRAAVVLPDGSRLTRTEAETPTERGPEAIVETARTLLETARREAPSDVAATLAGIGISSPGPVDPDDGRVIEPPNLGPRFKDIPLARELGDALGLPAFLDRDTNLAALGEHVFGAARGCDDFIYITVSTGVGGGVVTRGRLLRGADGLAGELGHVPVSLDGPPCGCGGVGHVEAYASGTGLARAAREIVGSGGSEFLARRASDVGVEELSAKDVAEGALAGDAGCTALMERARRALAAACVGYVAAFNPRRIVIGGSIAEAEGDRLLEPVRRAIAGETFEVMSRGVTVVPAGLGGDVSLAGAQPLVVGRLAEAEHPSSPITVGARRPYQAQGGPA